MILPECLELRKKIREAAASGMAVAELEYLDLSLRVINSLEDSKYGIVYISELLDFSEGELLEIPNLGQGGIDQIKKALLNFEKLGSVQARWHKGSDRLDYYKENIPRSTILT